MKSMETIFTLKNMSETDLYYTTLQINDTNKRIFDVEVTGDISPLTLTSNLTMN